MITTKTTNLENRFFYKLVNFIRLPFRFKIAKRLNRIQHLQAQLIAFMPILLFCVIVILLMGVAGINFNDGSINEIIYFLVDILVVLSWLVLSMIAHIARLHDCNHSGWWILLINLLSAYLIFPIFLLFIWPGSRGENKYGNPSSKIWVPANSR